MLSSEFQMTPVQAGQFFIVVEAVLAFDGGLKVTSIVAFPLGDHNRFDLAAAGGNESFNDVLLDLSIYHVHVGNPSIFVLGCGSDDH